MRAFRGQMREWLMGLALFALIFQALIPAAQAVPVQRDGPPGLDVLVICTGFGIKVLEQTTGEKSPVKQTSQFECPVCSVHSLKLSFSTADIPLPLPALHVVGFVQPALDHMPLRQASLPLLSIRAPPWV